MPMPLRFPLMLALFAACASVHATPINARLYKQQFGYMPSCNACHSDGGGSKLNGYGTAWKEAGKSSGAFDKIAAADSDGDGAANGAEAMAKANPGDKASKPGAAGNWLDMAALIPKDVQALFPGIRSWVPRDAVLTSADVTTARGMGATLSAADENTIYIPVEGQYPVGTALIFPVNFQGKTAYLLMATDKTLKITKVQVLNAGGIDAIRKSGFAGFAGQAAQAVVAAPGATLEAAIAQAVKNAGVLLYVRLKSA